MNSRSLIHDLRTDENGATAVEYGLIAALIVIAMIAGLGSLAGSNSSLWGTVENKGVDAMTR